MSKINEKPVKSDDNKLDKAIDRIKILQTKLVNANEEIGRLNQMLIDKDNRICKLNYTIHELTNKNK
jgi:hypothetical protein